MTGVLRFDDWTNPVPPVEREVVSMTEETDAKLPPLLFVPGLGHGAWAFAEHWLPATAARGFPAYALTPRPGGDLRAHVHDVVQVAASLPRQTVLVGHGTGALVVAYAMGRYPARAAVLAAPVMDGRPTLWAALRTNPFGTLPAIFGGRLRLNRKQLFSPGLPDERAREILDRLDARPRRELVTHKPAPDPAGDPPVLVVGSPDDRVVPRKSLDRTATRYGGAPLLFPGMGHDLLLDVAWAEPIEAILDWLTKELGN
ncbi:alpha/beta hydrolase [Paractinoplanes brasiliensis]|uniref:Alpha/beta hydrolase family protein n=1 Tax=Paractinoplanes brasiliensis TaxID=52695 RepID=A0A4R6JSX6_9ACTN|nr:alpha/beta fold hydrolase [Actinoplanes brasiliensis]TDO37765.1 alpha/beta hydrolase family protein [Actinoplanes brasiliensis]GID32105.1 alpha/beta hydrolase [Actinoplanes brasiliensis]